MPTMNNHPDNTLNERSGPAPKSDRGEVMTATSVTIPDALKNVEAHKVDGSDADKRNAADFNTPAMPAVRGETTDTENAGS